MVRLEPGDCLDVIPRLVADGVIVDAVVCDPPYGLGFMGKQWDGGDIAFRPETWATIGTIMRPGAFLLAFGGTRTFHRMACAIEDAGFVIQDSILSLISTDARVQRFLATLNDAQSEAFGDILDQMQPGGVGAWTYGSGFPKGRTQFKPAWEPIIMAYKPAGKRSLGVDECRIGTEERHNGRAGNKPGGNSLHLSVTGMPEDFEGTIVTGRWPANCVHDGSDDVMDAFAAFGEKTSVGHFPATQNQHDASSYSVARGRIADERTLETGSAARFFYCAKADKQDRWGSKHPTVKPVELMKWLVPLVTPKGGLVLDPFAGSGTTGVAALATGRNAILIEREVEYQNDIRERLAHYEGEGRHSLAVKNRSRSAQVGTLI